jgi:hypothetical protein
MTQDKKKNHMFMWFRDEEICGFLPDLSHPTKRARILLLRRASEMLALLFARGVPQVAFGQKSDHYGADSNDD